MKIAVGFAALVAFAAVYSVEAQTTSSNANDNANNDGNNDGNNSNTTQTGQNIYLDNVFGLNGAFILLGNDILRELTRMGAQCGCEGLTSDSLPRFPLPYPPPQVPGEGGQQKPGPPGVVNNVANGLRRPT